jgi:hypothetical protein
MSTEGTRRAGRWETLGAWLHVWTPRRDVEVPPPPTPRAIGRWTLLIGVPALVALAVAYALIDSGKDEGAARERRQQEAIHRSEVARLRAEQAPRHGRGRALPLHAPPARLRAARAALVGDLERAINADARARERAGKLDGHVKRTSCKPYTTEATNYPPDPPLSARVGRYDCLASVGSVDFGLREVSTGYPFWARVDFRSSRLVWCKINRVAGEGVATGLRDEVPLARECDLTR